MGLLQINNQPSLSSQVFNRKKKNQHSQLWAKPASHTATTIRQPHSLGKDTDSFGSLLVTTLAPCIHLILPYVGHEILVDTTIFLRDLLPHQFNTFERTRPHCLPTPTTNALTHNSILYHSSTALPTRWALCNPE